MRAQRRYLNLVKFVEKMEQFAKKTLVLLMFIVNYFTNCILQVCILHQLVRTSMDAKMFSSKAFYVVKHIFPNVPSKYREGMFSALTFLNITD